MTLDARRMLAANRLADGLERGDFASVILYDSQNDEAFLQKSAESLIDIVQAKGVALLIANDSRIAGRIKADGVHLEGKVDDLRQMIERHHDTMILGFGNLRDKHGSMEVGECEPDYLLFGKLGADKKPEAHSRNLTLAQWWSEVMEIPAIVQAGADIATFNDVLATGAEFIAIEEALFGAHDIVEAIDSINAMIAARTESMTESQG